MGEPRSEANQEGIKLLVGREREKRELLSKLTSSTLHATLEGDNGVGKTSLVLVTVYESIQNRLTGRNTASTTRR